MENDENKVARKGVPIIQRSRAEKIELATKICSKLSEGMDTIQSVCESYGVVHSTFLNWVMPKADPSSWSKEEMDKHVLGGFILEAHQMYKEARQRNVENFKETIIGEGRRNLLKRITGFSYDEVQTEMKLGDDGTTAKPVGVKKTTKQVIPDTVAIIFALKALDPDNFKDIQILQHEGGLKTTVTKGYEGMSIKELEAEEEKLQQLLIEAERTEVKKKSDNYDNIEEAHTYE